MILCNTQDCENIVEGKTQHCASCNSRIRKIAKRRIADGIKRKELLSKSKPWYPAPKKVSEKRKVINEEYFKLVEQFKRDNPKCAAKINEFCTDKTDDPHHSKGRGKYLLDLSTWIPTCRSCHIYIEQHPVDAQKRGLSFSRLSNQPTI